MNTNTVLIIVGAIVIVLILVVGIGVMRASAQGDSSGQGPIIIPGKDQDESDDSGGIDWSEGSGGDSSDWSDKFQNVMSGITDIASEVPWDDVFSGGGS